MIYFTDYLRKLKKVILFLHHQFFKLYNTRMIDDRNGRICLMQSQHHLYIAFMHRRVQTTTGILMVMISWNHMDSVYMVALTRNNVCFFQVRAAWLNYVQFFIFVTPEKINTDSPGELEKFKLISKNCVCRRVISSLCFKWLYE